MGSAICQHASKVTPTVLCMNLVHLSCTLRCDCVQQKTVYKDHLEDQEQLSELTSRAKDNGHLHQE